MKNISEKIPEKITSITSKVDGSTQKISKNRRMSKFLFGCNSSIFDYFVYFYDVLGVFSCNFRESMHVIALWRFLWVRLGQRR